MKVIDKKVLNFLVIIVLTVITFWWTFFIYHIPFTIDVVISVIAVRIIASLLIYKDYSLSWSKATQKSFLLKSVVYISAFLVYLPIFYGEYRFSFLLSELMLYLFSINFLMYTYYYFANKSSVEKTKSVVIYGAGKAGIKLEEEFHSSEYRVKYFVDDDTVLQGRSIDSIRILSQDELKSKLNNSKYDLLVISMPSTEQSIINEIYKELNIYFNEIQILPSLEDILRDQDFSTQLKEISVEDLLARHPKDLDKDKISEFIKDKTVLITGAGGSIGSEIVRQCAKFKARKLILIDHSEFNLYTIEQEMHNDNIIPVMQSVTNVSDLEKNFL